MNELVPRNTDVETNDIRPLICELRGQPVMLDRDLASLYHVMTGRLNEAVKRNIARFPPEFMFQLSGTEMKELIANCDRFRTMKHSPSRMYAFTEQGVAMLSAVLKSDIAVRESIRIMKAFVSMRRVLAAAGTALTSLVARVEANERRQIEDQSKNDAKFVEIFARMGAGDVPGSQIFYQGQLWDARALVLSLISRAKRSLVLIDNWATAELLGDSPSNYLGTVPATTWGQSPCMKNPWGQSPDNCGDSHRTTGILVFRASCRVSQCNGA